MPLPKRESAINGPAKRPEAAMTKPIKVIGDYPVTAPGVVRTCFTLENGTSFWLTLTHADALKVAANLTAAVARNLEPTDG